MSTAVQYPLRDLIDLQHDPYPSSPPPASTSAPSKRDNSLDRWRENDGDDDWGELPTSTAKKGKGKAVEADGPPKRQSKMSERSKRAVASESWDDDFLFQHDPPPPPSRPPSRSRSRPTTPAHRSVSSTSRIPPSPSSPPPRRPMSPPQSLVLNGPATLSLDSLASSVGWSSDQDPTVTVPPTSTQSATPRPPSRPSHQTHRKSESTATARPPLSRQTTPRSRIPKPAPSSNSRHVTPHSEDDDFRSATPSLTEDSFNSLTTGEELATETEDEQTDVAVASPTLRQAPVIERVPSTRKWRFSRSGKAESNKAEAPASAFSGFLGRRASVAPREPEVMMIDRQEFARSRQSNSPRNALPRPQQSADSATPRQTRATAATRGKHSSTASTATVSSEGSASNDRARRTSLQFAPLSTTGPDMSELSEDDDVVPAGRARTRHAARPTASATTTPSTSYISPSTRPVSPVESILGGDKTRWNASQVSFASTASAFALRRDGSARQYEGRGADATAGRKRKLVKKRPVSTVVGEQESLTASSLGLSNDGTSERPLLAPSIFSTSSGGSSYPDSNRTVLTRSRSTRPMPSLAFARESGDEGGTRGTTRPTTRQRAVANPPRPTSAATVSPRKGEKGQVVELDREWLGVVPFPPSPRASLEAPPPGPSLPTSASRSSLRPTSGFLRKMSGKSHPPVTGRTQAEAKQTKRGSGIGSSITNLLSRSTSALPLAGKRAPSPAPSSKSVKSSKSLLLRRSSKKGKDDEPEVPKSPSIGALRKRRSVTAPVTGKSPSMPSLPSSPPPPPLPRSGSAFSFITRARGFSRSSPRTETPPSPRKPSTSVDAPPVPPIPPPRPPRPSPAVIPAQTATRPPPSHGQLNAAYRMPGTSASTAAGPSGSRPAQLAPTSTARAAATSRPPKTRPLQAGHRPSVSLSSIMPLRSTSPLPRPPQPPLGVRTSQQSFASDNPSTAGESDRPPTVYSFGDDLVNGEDTGVPRRNSLSDLRIPARITNAQKKIEEDLERVKQFAAAIEELKALRGQYEELVQVMALPSVSPQHLSPDQPSKNAVAKTAQAIRRVELDYASWWEQAQTLIDLGDGKPRQAASRPSPGTLASRRDRCVSLAPEKTDRRHSRIGSESEAETIASARPADSTVTKRQVKRRPSASSIETAASVAHRQKEMLRGVLAAPHKGASLPSRAPPSPRPPLTVITQPDSATSSVSLQSGRRVSPLFAALASPSTPSLSPEKPSPASRRVSRTGVFGIREFLLRLRSRATEELAASVQTDPQLVSAGQAESDVAPAPRRSVSDPTYRSRHVSRPTPAVSVAPPMSRHAPRTASNSTSDSDEDWDLEFSPPRGASVLQLAAEDTTSSLSRRHGRTSSVAGVRGKTASADAKLVLTTEAMPSLLEKVREVREACETCIGLLKGLTV
ncbi:uncharacterized protein RHTO_04557 [Rhodotorula toruloides NP11]|uniref:Uncharacterized protein n=1 Tax=Rhodotorula toruloides (strain NP11) TaxID=1130832 RepID=M7WNF6_RHOT1|nr:uncharacterized protein RHTO_04557 [Rhodotorula toruloides NP11]EMS19365.1 hypothetical protein RHTO_04557 [Rhodotorula toruloides NP11]